MSWFNTKCSRFLAMFMLLAAPLVAQDNLTAKRPFGQHTTSFSATPTFDAGVTDSWKMTLTGNVTSSTLIGPEAGHTYTWEICQDGVGGRTFVWPSQLVSPISISGTINACTTEIFYYDGTNGLIPTTTTGGGGGSGTVNSGTVNQIAKYTAATTVSSDANLDDGLTAANTLTYLGTSGISAAQFNATGTGAMTLVGNEGTCSGAAAGKDILCLGDATSHSIQGSLNGSSFFPYAQHQSTSPTPHGIMVAETFPQIFAIPTGAAGQAILSGGSGADPGPAALNLAGGATIVSGILPKVNHPTSTVFNDQVNTFTTAGTADLSASTVTNAFRVPSGAGLTVSASSAIGYDSTNNMFHGGQNSADSFFINSTAAPANNDCMKWVVVSGNKTAGTAGAACGAGGGAPPLHTITAATGANSINNGDNAQTWNASLTTSGKHWFTISENSASIATGTPYLWDIHSIASSTANPLIVTAQGTANGWNMLNNSGNPLWAPLGTGSIALPGSAHNLVVSQAGSAAVTYIPPVLAGKVLIDNGPGNDPSFQDPIISQAYVNIWNAATATGTLTSSAVRNPVFSQTGTLQITWASITGSPATCTFQVQGVDSLGNVLNNGSTFSVSPANGTTSQTFTAASTLQTAAQVKVIFACVTYPTTGTLTLDFTPIPNVNVTNALTTTDAATSATGSAVPSKASYVGGNGSGNLTGIITCDNSSPINISSATSTQIIAISGTGGRTYICSMDIVVSAADNVALISGSGSNCASNQAGLAGGTTAATGWNFAANGGLTKGSGLGMVFKTVTTNNEVCLVTSSTAQVSGSISWTQF